MADLNIQMRKKNGEEWDKLYPYSKAENITFIDGDTLQEKLDNKLLGSDKNCPNITTSDSDIEDIENLDIVLSEEYVQVEGEEGTISGSLLNSIQDQVEVNTEDIATLNNNIETITNDITTHTHDNYLPLTGGTLTGILTTGSNINLNGPKTTGITKNSSMILRNNGTATVLSSINNSIYFRPSGDDISTNEIQMKTDGSVKANKFVGELEGNADTATKLLTARNITIGTAAKTFDGSEDIQFTLDEIGAVTATYVSNAIANAQLGGEGGDIDLSGFATQDDIQNLGTAIGYKADKEHTHEELLGINGGEVSGDIVFNTAKGLGATIINDTLDTDGNTVPAGTQGQSFIFNHNNNMYIGYLIADKKLASGSSYLYGGANIYHRTNTGNIYFLPANKNTVTMYPDYTLTSKPIHSSLSTGTYIKGNQGIALLNSTSAAGAYTTLIKSNTENGCMTLNSCQKEIRLAYTDEATIDAETNDVTYSATLLDETGNSSFPGAVSAGSFRTGGHILPKEYNASKVNVGTTSLPFQYMIANRFYCYGSDSNPYASLRTETLGTTTTNGTANLYLGNNYESGTEGNAVGKILMYGTSSGYTSIAVGNNTTTNNTVYLPTTGGTLSLASNIANGSGSKSLMQTSAITAVGNYSVALGSNTSTGAYGQLVTGKYNTPQGTAANAVSTDNAFIIGNGSSTTTANAFRVTYGGAAYGKSAYNTTGADYAEFFEWADGNPDNEERLGYFVAFDGSSNKIRKANESDGFVLGIISSDAAIIGDNHADEWKDKFMRDKWDRIIYDTVTREEEVTELDEEGHEVVKTITITEDVPRINPDFDDNKDYVSRENRPEWSPVGMLGKLLVNSDGTCQVGDFCRPNNDGIATKAETGYYVLEVREDNIIKVLIK